MKLKGAMLKDAREGKGLTQLEMARTLAMTQATLSKAENGDDISVTTARIVCEFLGVDLTKAQIPRMSGEGDAA